MPRRGLRLVALLATAALLAAACTGDDDDAAGTTTTDTRSPDDPIEGGTLRLGVERLRTFDPAFVSPASQGELLAADLVFDGLTAMGADDDEAVPAIAASWEPAADLTTWRFSLRPDAVFSNGRAVTATDVKYTLERVAKRGSGSLAGVRLDVISGFPELLAGTVAELTGVRAVDARTVEIVTRYPFAPLPELLSSPAFGIVPREEAEAAGAAFATRPVGSGPFSVAGTTGDVVRLVRTTDGSALLDGIELHQYDDLGVAYDDFVDEQLDWTLLAADDVEAAAEGFGDEGMTPFQAELFFGFNLANPKFADIRLRQAIVKAVDRDALVRAVYAGVAEPLAAVVPAGVPGHVADACGCGYDPDGARALAGALAAEAPLAEVQLDYYEGAAEEAVATIVETSLEAVGIPAAKRPQPFEQYQQFAVSGQQELFRLGWIGVYRSPEAYLGPLFQSGGLDNAMAFADPGVDAALTAARSTADPRQRRTRYAEVERAVMALVPIVPVAQFTTRSVAGERVRDLTLSVDGTFDGTVVWLAAE
jgi:ABC-type transport system substrate-binding protein